jgi:hypothetical protein
MTLHTSDVPGQIPPAYRRTGVPRGATVRIRAKRDAPPPHLTVEDATGTAVLTITVNPDGQLDAEYDPARMTEAARLFLLEVRQLLGLRTLDPFIRVATDPSPPRPPCPPRP